MVTTNYMVAGGSVCCVAFLSLVAIVLSIWALSATHKLGDEFSRFPLPIDVTSSEQFVGLEARVGSLSELETQFATLQSTVHRERTSNTGELATLRRAIAEHTPSVAAAPVEVRRADLVEVQARLAALEQLQTKTLKTLNSASSTPPNWMSTLQRITNLEKAPKPSVAPQTNTQVASLVRRIASLEDAPKPSTAGVLQRLSALEKAPKPAVTNTLQRIVALENAPEAPASVDALKRIEVVLTIMNEQTIPLTADNILLTLASVEDHYEE